MKSPIFQYQYLSPPWYKIQCLNLEENHRQGEDREYADILNRIRIGKETEEDLQKIKERVRLKKKRDKSDNQNRKFYISIYAYMNCNPNCNLLESKNIRSWVSYQGMAKTIKLTTEILLKSKCRRNLLEKVM